MIISNKPAAVAGAVLIGFADERALVGGPWALVEYLSSCIMCVTRACRAASCSLSGCCGSRGQGAAGQLGTAGAHRALGCVGLQAMQPGGLHPCSCCEWRVFL
jgi:hypothetical protein